MICHAVNQNEDHFLVIALAPLSRWKCTRKRYSPSASSNSSSSSSSKNRRVILVIRTILVALHQTILSAEAMIRRCRCHSRSTTVLPATVTWIPVPLANIPRRRIRARRLGRYSTRRPRRKLHEDDERGVRSDGWRGRNKQGSCAGEVSPSTGALPRIRPLW